MPALRIQVVRMGGGYLKALLPDREQTIYGRDEKELLGKLKRLRISDPISFTPRKRTA
jgi:hypothetical protein